jgi:hypothetical protein
VSTPKIELTDKRIDKLIALIKDSFRTRPNHDPVYVDIGGNLERVKASQHQAISVDAGRARPAFSCILRIDRRIRTFSRSTLTPMRSSVWGIQMS